MTEDRLHNIIKGCKEEDRNCQQELFAYMYNFGMSVASRYAQNRFETEEIANEAFYKIMTSLDKYNLSIPFKNWSKRVIINCGIDYYRKHHKKGKLKDFDYLNVANTANEAMDADYLRNLVQGLSPGYRIVFVLHAIEGYSHDEISKKLNISKGTSKSNLSKARAHLQKAVECYKQKYVKL